MDFQPPCITGERFSKGKQKKNATISGFAEIKTFHEVDETSEEDDENAENVKMLSDVNKCDVTKSEDVISIEVPLLSKSKTCNFGCYQEANGNKHCDEPKQVVIYRKISNFDSQYMYKVEHEFMDDSKAVLIKNQTW